MKHSYFSVAVVIFLLQMSTRKAQPPKKGKAKKARTEIPPPVSEISPQLQEAINKAVATAVTASLQATSQPSTSGQGPLPEVQPAESHFVPAVDFMAAFQPAEGEPMIDSNVNNVALFDLPLGANLSDKNRIKIKMGQYVDLYQLLNPQQEQAQPVMLSSINGAPAINIQQHQQKQVLTIEQWTNAMHVYATIYLQANPAEVAALLKYIDFIRKMASRTSSQAWRVYDEVFRRSKPNTKYPWDKPLWSEYVAAMTMPLVNSNKPHTNSPFRGSQHIPKGSCVAFHTKFCRFPPGQCRYSHKCPKCAGNHPVKWCRNASNTAKPATANMPPKK